MLTATPLPPFDQAQLDRRFLAELDRLLTAGVFPTYTAWAQAVGVHPSRVAAIARGAYHCNLTLLYDTVRHFPACDFNYVVFGSAVYARPEPAAVPHRRRGPAPGSLQRARTAVAVSATETTRKPTGKI
ncbi:MAG: hypothetical protein ACRYFX_09220 [Janthinobacterium lividum]